MSEQTNDIVVVNVPLLIRIMEYAREDAKTDIDLHKVAEQAISLMEKNDVLTMDNYDDLVTPSNHVKESYKVDDIVYPNIGPHKGKEHKVIHVNNDGSYNITPTKLRGNQVKYRLGAARANNDQLSSAKSEGYNPKTGQNTYTEYDFDDDMARFKKKIMADKAKKLKADADAYREASGGSSGPSKKYTKNEEVTNKMHKPLAGHLYHKKTVAELQYIVKDAGEAAKSMKNHNPTAEAKYLDQVNDASTILHYRKNGGVREGYTDSELRKLNKIAEALKGRK